MQYISSRGQIENVTGNQRPGWLVENVTANQRLR